MPPSALRDRLRRLAGAPRVVNVEGLQQARLERLEHRSRALTRLSVKPLKVAREPQERRSGQASILIEARPELLGCAHHPELKHTAHLMREAISSRSGGT